MSTVTTANGSVLNTDTIEITLEGDYAVGQTVTFQGRPCRVTATIPVDTEGTDGVAHTRLLVLPLTADQIRGISPPPVVFDEHPFSLDMIDEILSQFQGAGNSLLDREVAETIGELRGATAPYHPALASVGGGGFSSRGSGPTDRATVHGTQPVTPATPELAPRAAFQRIVDELHRMLDATFPGERRVLSLVNELGFRTAVGQDLTNLRFEVNVQAPDVSQYHVQMWHIGQDGTETCWNVNVDWERTGRPQGVLYLNHLGTTRHVLAPQAANERQVPRIGSPVADPPGAPGADPAALWGDLAHLNHQRLTNTINDRQWLAELPRIGERGALRNASPSTLSQALTIANAIHRRDEFRGNIAAHHVYQVLRNEVEAINGMRQRGVEPTQENREREARQESLRQMASVAAMNSTAGAMRDAVTRSLGIPAHLMGGESPSTRPVLPQVGVDPGAPGGGHTVTNAWRNLPTVTGPTLMGTYQTGEAPLQSFSAETLRQSIAAMRARVPTAHMPLDTVFVNAETLRHIRAWGATPLDGDAGPSTPTVFMGTRIEVDNAVAPGAVVAGRPIPLDLGMTTTITDAEARARRHWQNTPANIQARLAAERSQRAQADEGTPRPVSDEFPVGSIGSIGDGVRDDSEAGMMDAAQIHAITGLLGRDPNRGGDAYTGEDPSTHYNVEVTRNQTRIGVAPGATVESVPITVESEYVVQVDRGFGDGLGGEELLQIRGLRRALALAMGMYAEEAGLEINRAPDTRHEATWDVELRGERIGRLVLQAGPYPGGPRRPSQQESPRHQTSQFEEGQRALDI